MGKVRVTQSSGSSYKVCYPFMKGNVGHICFCPVWSKNDTSSFLPAGLRCIWHPDHKNETVEWNTRRKYLNRSSTSTYSVNTSIDTISRTWTMNEPQAFRFFCMYDGCSAFKDPPEVTRNGTAAIDSHVHNRGSTDARYAKSADRPHVVYLSKGYESSTMGIVPALESSSMGKKSTATAVFGAILSVPKTWTSAVVHTICYSSYLGQKFHFNTQLKRPSDAGEIIGASGWLTGNSSPHAHLTYYVNGKMNAQTSPWPDDNNIFTGCKYLGDKGNNYVFFHQMTATLDSGTIIAPPMYILSSSYNNKNTYEDPLVYDQWIGFKV